jgi:putative copper export protein
MDFWYLVAVYVHIVTVAVWLGAMLFEDPSSNRFMARIVVRIRGIGWVSLLVLIATGVYMLAARGVSLDDVSGRFFAQRYGQVFAAKLAFVVLLVGLQVTRGHRPSRALYGYLASMLIVIALSVWLVRPLV